MPTDIDIKLSIVIPAYNEASSIGVVLDDIRGRDLPLHELIVVSDGSKDETAKVVRQRDWVRLIEQPYNIGNGAAVKTGIRAATGNIILMMDGDGQHKPEDISRLLEHIDRYHMVVGARTAESDTEAHRDLANMLYNAIAGYLVGYRVDDLTSGFRAIRAPVAKRYVGLLPNGFSYPTTITIALFRSGLTVNYVPIVAPARKGRSNIKLLRDGFGFLLTLARIGTLFVPLKLFLPLAGLLALVGGGYGAFLILFQGRFTNMPVLLILSAVVLFMMGLISEQIALLRLMQVEHGPSESA